jgi:diguanylate cyclase (GGDEF)-like protein
VIETLPRPPPGAHSVRTRRGTPSGSSGSALVGILDLDGTVRYISASALDSADLKATDLIGKPLEHLPSLWTSRVRRQLRSAIRDAMTGRGSHFDIVITGGTGRPLTLQFSLEPVQCANEETAYFVFSVQDLAERRPLQRYDVLTGLPNRCQLLHILERRLRESERSNAEIALLVVGLDRLTLINDSLGKAGGDQVLVEVARRLTRCAGEGVTVGRVSDDEFAIAVTAERSVASPSAELADSILAALSLPIQIGDEPIYVSCGIGVATGRDGCETAEDLIANAGIALREVRRRAGGPMHLFTQRCRVRDRERLRLEADLHRAIDDGEFVLFYQPRVDARFGRIQRLEALIRWPGPDGRWVAPARFIPIAEETGLIHPIGAWALRTAVIQARVWQTCIASMTGISVNLSARQFRQPDLTRSIARLLEITGLQPERLELELTETMLISDAEDAIRSMHALKNLGIRLSLDDFGTGYSSLSYLGRFPIDALKIDQVFVQKMETDEASAAIVDTVISIAHRLGLSVTAEGVETEKQLALLREQGCDEVQGYLIAHPLPIAQIESLLDAQGSLLPKAAT